MVTAQHEEVVFAQPASSWVKPAPFLREIGGRVGLLILPPSDRSRVRRRLYTVKQNGSRSNWFDAISQRI